MIYLDNAATTALDAEVLQAMMPYLTTEYGNPNSVHAAGAAAAWAVMRARAQVAEALGCRPAQVEFTSGGTESDNQALLTAAQAGAARGCRHIVSSAIEHPAVLRMLERLERHGFTVTRVAPDADGVVAAAAIEAALTPETCLVSLMWVNNETGAIQPVEAVAALCRARGIGFHTDAVQAAGMLPIDCTAVGADLLSLSAHKFHGPKGVGILVARDTEPAPLLVGGQQERGHRAGTLNVPGIVGAAAALARAQERCAETADRVRTLRQRLEQGLQEQLPDVRILGAHDPARRAPGIVCACFAGVERESLLVLLDQAGICASAGSACAAGAVEPSHVLAAMGVPDAYARGAIRFSLGDRTTQDEIDQTVQATVQAVGRLRNRRAR